MYRQRIIAALLTLVLLLGLGACGQKIPYVVYEAVYQQGAPSEQVEHLGTFFPASAQVFLSGTQEENVLYSPLNLYLALALLAESTGGETQQEIMDLLGTSDLDALRTQASALWRANFQDRKHITSTLANALWLDEQAEYVPETLKTLSRSHHASIFQGPMGDKAYDQALHTWIDQQTHGLLSDQSSGLKMPELGVLVLMSTLYFRGEWEDPFYPEATAPGTFHSPDGDLRCDFMGQLRYLPYAQGASFSAVGKDITKGGAMWFVLPEEESSIDALLADPELYAFLEAGTDWEGCQEDTYTELYLPKFDVSSNLNLQDGLQTLGVTKVFDPEQADFSPVIAFPSDDLSLAEAKHAARVLVDETGCLAAAYTALAVGADADPIIDVVFTLDRPFLFVLTNQNGLPLFMGVVNTPA